MSDKTLIIRSTDNKFERFVTSHIESKGFKVVEPFVVPLNKMTKFQLFRLRSRVALLYKDLIGNWKNEIDSFDTIIIFDNALSVQLVKYILACNKKCNIKIWLWNCRKINRSFFSRFCSIYTFDEDFAKENNYGYIPQFYFADAISRTNCKKHSVYYIGYDKDRYELLKKFAKVLNNYGIEYKFILRKATNKLYDDYSPITLVDKDVDYEDVLSEIKACSCILELNEGRQTGLTLRSLEAIFSGNKLITNNKKIKSFDFYNPNNVFIIGEDNEDSLNDFIYGRYIDPPEAIVEKYKFEYWIKQIIGD